MQAEELILKIIAGNNNKVVQMNMFGVRAAS